MHWPPTSDEFARLLDTLGWVVERSPYYRGLLAGAGVRVADLGTYDDLRRRVPRTAKTDLVANQRAHPPFGEFLAVPRSEFGSLHTSPGTDPDPAPRRRARRHAGAGGVDPCDGRAAGRRRARHAVVPHHAGRPAAAPRVRGGGLPGASTAGRATAGCRWRSPRAWRATVYAGTPSFLANLGDTAREHGARSATRPALPRRLLDRRGADAAAAPRAAGHLRHRALRSLRRGADRSARRRVPRARRHAPARARPLLRVPRSRDRRAGGGGRHGRAGRDAARAARAAAGALRAGRRLPAARRARVRAATRRRASSSSDRWAPSARSRACSCIRRRCTRALSELPGGRPLPDRRRSSRGASATIARCCASGLTAPAGRSRPRSRARIAERVKADRADRDGRRAGGGVGAAGGRRRAALRRQPWSIDGSTREPRGRRRDRRYYDPAHPDDAAASACARCRPSGWRDSSTACGRRRCRSSRKLEAAGLRRADLRGLDDLAAIPTTVKAELRASEEEHPPFGDYRGAPASAGGPAGRVDRHERPADADPLDAPGPRGRSRGVGARTLALGAAPGDEPRQRASVRHERRRLALQPRRRGARRAQHPVRAAGRRGARRAT